ncbi:hypothetical protein HPG69_005791 [Diceros bicornis minor]|uniref:Uncharacterized protein n=1 Tax=Diceros bicornis minor TaxID=77932 RepID=A0A7J7ESU0_DICBM|nr:hypothetical protein HPG69_005791 [Diceros bicornis minor]
MKVAERKKGNTFQNTTRGKNGCCRHFVSNGCPVWDEETAEAAVTVSITILPIRSWKCRHLDRVMGPIVIKEGREVMIDMRWYGAAHVHVDRDFWKNRVTLLNYLCWFPTIHIWPPNLLFLMESLVWKEYMYGSPPHSAQCISSPFIKVNVIYGLMVAFLIRVFTICCISISYMMIIFWGHTILPSLHFIVPSLYLLLPPTLNSIVYGVKAKQIQDSVTKLFQGEKIANIQDN